MGLPGRATRCARLEPPADRWGLSGGGALGRDRQGGRPAGQAGNGKCCARVLCRWAFPRSEGAARPRAQAGGPQVEGLRPEDGPAGATSGRLSRETSERTES